MRVNRDLVGILGLAIGVGLVPGAAPIHAGTLIVPTSQTRSLSGSASAEDPFDGQISDSDSDQATDFGRFDTALSANASVSSAIGSGGGQQDSQILADTITAAGSMFANAEVWDFKAFAEASSTNRMEVTFQLTAESMYTLQGELNAFDEAITELSLRDARQEIYGAVIFGPATTLPVNESGTLPAGEYTLSIVSSGSAFGGDFFSAYSFGDYDITLHFMSTGPGGEVPDGDDVMGGMPLRLSRQGNELNLGWSASCRPDDLDYAVYAAPIDDPANRTPLVCTTGGLLEQTFSLTDRELEGSLAFLVVPTDGITEGSYGGNSAGVERTPSPSACFVQSLGAPVCP